MKLKAILFGLLAWFNVSLIVFGTMLFLMRALSSDSTRTFIPSVRPVSVLISAGTAFLAGYVAGRTAKADELTHAGLIGVIIVGVNITGVVVVSRYLKYQEHSIGQSIAREAFTFALVVSGGFLAKWRNERDLKC